MIPEVVLLLGHCVHQDLQAMPPHPTALLMKVKGHVPAERNTHTHARVLLALVLFYLLYKALNESLT